MYFNNYFVADSRPSCNFYKEKGVLTYCFIMHYGHMIQTNDIQLLFLNIYQYCF